MNDSLSEEQQHLLTYSQNQQGATHLGELFGPPVDVDDIVRGFTAADALEVFEEFAYGVPPTVDYSSPKGVNATLDPAVFDTFPRTSSLISLSPPPDHVHAGKASSSSSPSSSSSSSTATTRTSSVESSPLPYHHHLAAPIVSDVDPSGAAAAAASADAFAHSLPPLPLHTAGASPYQLDQDIMDELTSAAAAIEQQAAAGYGDCPQGDGGGASSSAAAGSRAPSKGKDLSKSKKAKKSSTQTSADEAGRFKPFHEEKWDQKLAELLDFRAAHGHCLVPHTYDPNPQLARWVKRQRRQYKLLQAGKTSTMTPERVGILEEAGFVWDSHEISWREKMQELAQYREQHGDTLVPSSYRDNPQLATWVKCQRRQYKLYHEGKPSGMSPHRIEQLDRIGFCWEIRPNNEHVYGNPNGPAGGTSLPSPEVVSSTSASAASSRKRGAGGASGAGGPVKKKGRKTSKRDSLSLLGEAASLL